MTAQVYVLFAHGEEGPEAVAVSTDANKLISMASDTLKELREEIGEGRLSVPDWVLGDKILHAFGNDYGDSDTQDIMTIETVDFV